MLIITQIADCKIGNIKKVQKMRLLTFLLQDLSIKQYWRWRGRCVKGGAKDRCVKGGARGRCVMGGARKNGVVGRISVQKDILGKISSTEVDQNCVF